MLPKLEPVTLPVYYVELSAFSCQLLAFGLAVRRVDSRAGLRALQFAGSHALHRDPVSARQALERVVPDGWYVDSQEPITLSASEPEPDVAVIRDSRDYLDRHPGAAEVGRIVELAEASLHRDRVRKKHIYAAAASIGVAPYVGRARLYR